MRLSVRCNHKKRQRRGPGKQSLLYAQVLEAGDTTHARLHGKDVGVVKRQTTGVGNT